MVWSWEHPLHDYIKTIIQGVDYLLVKDVFSPLVILPPSFHPCLPSCSPSVLVPFNAGALQCWCPWMLALSDSPNNFLFVIFTVWYSIIVLKSRLTHIVPITQRKLKPLTLFKDIRGCHGHSSRLLIQLFVWQLLRWSGAFALRWSMCLTFTGLGCLDLWKCLSWEE